MSADFYTEFPIRKSLGISEFRDLVIRWIGGIELSDLEPASLETGLKNEEIVEFDGQSGECLRAATFQEDDRFITGVQYDLPDKEFRIWRSEIVLRKLPNEAFMSVRVRCISDTDAAVAQSPKRPFLVKQIVGDGFGAPDGDLIVSDAPHYISDTEIEKAARIILGESTFCLPVIYVSSRTDGTLGVNVDDLAFQLGGLAHVIVEPDREFSFMMKDRTGGCNPYAGAIGLGLPGSSISLRVFPNKSSKAIVDTLISYVSQVFANRTARYGYEWSDLQQAIIRSGRQNLGRPTGDVEVDAWIDSFEHELQEKDEVISQLRRDNARLRGQLAANLEQSGLSQIVSDVRAGVGELYEGEITDRIQNAAVAAAGDGGYVMHERDRLVMREIAKQLSLSARSKDLVDRLKRAGKEQDYPKALSKELMDIGFSYSEEGKHIKLIPPNDLPALGQITLPKTPGDFRSGGGNAVTAIRGALGLRFGAD